MNPAILVLAIFTLICFGCIVGLILPDLWEQKRKLVEQQERTDLLRAQVSTLADHVKLPDTRDLCEKDYEEATKDWLFNEDRRGAYRVIWRMGWNKGAEHARLADIGVDPHLEAPQAEKRRP